MDLRDRLTHVDAQRDGWRVPGHALLLALLGWLTWRAMGYTLEAGDINGSFLHLIHLVFHEAGHVVFLPLGETMTLLGGSLLQVLVPVAVAAAFLQRWEPFGAAVGVWWTGHSLLDVATYVFDARARLLLLLGGGDGMETGRHDWYQLLSRAGWLAHDHRIARVLEACGTLLLWLALAWGAWLVWRQWHAEA